ncbi:DUF6197 family protein [Streptomyces xiamenensis]|uniref:DUF6197 family protein n=1 Tax=Streptomyces xiamenensis TaxID=408015 RepID=UPI0037CF2A34
MQPTQDIAAVLRRAVTVLDERGRTVGDFENRESCAVCAIGAIRVAAHDDPWTDSDLSTAVIRAVAARIDTSTIIDPIERIADWHDEPGRTDDEVTIRLGRIADEFEWVTARRVVAA